MIERLDPSSKPRWDEDRPPADLTLLARYAEGPPDVRAVHSRKPVKNFLTTAGTSGRLHSAQFARLTPRQRDATPRSCHFPRREFATAGQRFYLTVADDESDISTMELLKK